MKKIAVFASGSGSNAENISRYFFNSETINVALVLSTRPTAGVHGRVKTLNVPSFSFTHEEFSSGEKIVSILSEYDVDLIVLAGFMSKISDSLLKVYPGKIINIHPALLPKFGGKGMYGIHVHKAVIAEAEAQSGITIHYINEHYDEGEIIFQTSCPVYSTDTPETLAERIHSLEYKYYPEVIEKLLSASE